MANNFVSAVVVIPVVIAVAVSVVSSVFHIVLVTEGK